jgi:hypothetical protein
MEPRVCARCKGVGQCESPLPNEGMRECYACRGAGQFPEPEWRRMVEEIRTRKGVRTKPPKDSFRDLYGRRVYALWRFVRFHAGIDVTMPMMAGSMIGSDPWFEEINALAEEFARRVLRVARSAGRARWQPLLTNEQPDTTGLPATAQPGGPIVTEDKPWFEALEAK